MVSVNVRLLLIVLSGLYIRPGLWRDLDDFSSGSVCMVLASEVYQTEDYIRDYDEFIKFRNED